MEISRRHGRFVGGHVPLELCVGPARERREMLQRPARGEALLAAGGNERFHRDGGARPRVGDRLTQFAVGEPPAVGVEVLGPYAERELSVVVELLRT